MINVWKVDPQISLMDLIKTVTTYFAMLRLLWEIWTFFGHTVFLVWWFGGRFRKYTLTMEDSWWSGWRISIGSVSTPNGRAGWLMYQGSRRWGGWADSFVSTWAQYSVHILCVHMAYLHIAHYTLLCVHSWLAHCLFTDCFCAQLVCTMLNEKLLVCEVRHDATQAGMNTWAQASYNAVRCLCVCPKYCVHALWCKRPSTSFLCRGAYKWRNGLYWIAGLMLLQNLSQMCMS